MQGALIVDRIVRKRPPGAAPRYPLLHGMNPSSAENPVLYPAVSRVQATADLAFSFARHSVMPWAFCDHIRNPGSVSDEARGTVCVVLHEQAAQRDVERVRHGTCLTGVTPRD